jgi:hypothetical protein
MATSALLTETNTAPPAALLPPMVHSRRNKNENGAKNVIREKKV